MLDNIYTIIVTFKNIPRDLIFQVILHFIIGRTQVRVKNKFLKNVKELIFNRYRSIQILNIPFFYTFSYINIFFEFVCSVTV